MGIKFKCPSGHKIHVKAFLAGKRGICPTCGTKVEIPLISADEFRGAADAGDVPVEIQLSTATVAQPAPVASENVPAAASVAPATTPSATVAAPASAPVAAATVVSTPALPPATSTPVAVAAAAMPDPIAEKPKAVWYVRPRSGGQFGPAPGAMLRQWIAENRVAIDSLVWRDDWPQWQTAGDVLPDFSTARTPLMTPVAGIPGAVGGAAVAVVGGGVASGSAFRPAVATTSPVAAPATSAPGSTTAGSTTAGSTTTDSYAALRRRRRRNAIVTTAFLAIVAVALVIVLIWRLKNS